MLSLTTIVMCVHVVMGRRWARRHGKKFASCAYTLTPFVPTLSPTPRGEVEAEKASGDKGGGAAVLGWGAAVLGWERARGEEARKSAKGAAQGCVEASSIKPHGRSNDGPGLGAKRCFPARPVDLSSLLTPDRQQIRTKKDKEVSKKHAVTIHVPALFSPLMRAP